LEIGPAKTAIAVLEVCLAVIGIVDILLSLKKQAGVLEV
jgi:hypothetical protein